MAKVNENLERLREEYLQSRAEDKREEFLSRSLERQYAAVRAWDHRRREADQSKNPKKKKGLTPGEVLRHIQSLPTLINMIPSLSDKDFDAMYQALDEAREALRNFNATKTQMKIQSLEQQRDELQRRIDQLRNSQ